LANRKTNAAIIKVAIADSAAAPADVVGDVAEQQKRGDVRHRVGRIEQRQGDLAKSQGSAGR